MIQLYFWLNFLFSRKSEVLGANTKSIQNSKVSVIVTIKNNTQEFKRTLPYLTNQNYSNYEVIVVDDGSDEAEFMALQGFVEEYGSIRLIRNENATVNSGKRSALLLGTAASTGDFLLFTDSDCMPGSSKWISLMMEGVHSPEIDIVIGISPYTKDAGLLNRIILFETLQSASLMIGFLEMGNPYMGLGRNLLLRRLALLESKALEYEPLISGDDDLTVNRLATSRNTSWVKGQDAYVFTTNTKDFQGYMHQKKRHFSAGKYYKLSDKRRLGLLALSHSVFILLTFLIMLLFPAYATVTLLLFLIRSIVVVGVLDRNSKYFSMPIGWCWIFIFDLLLPIYYLVFSANIFFKDIKRW